MDSIPVRCADRSGPHADVLARVRVGTVRGQRRGAGGVDSRESGGGGRCFRFPGVGRVCGFIMIIIDSWLRD